MSAPQASPSAPARSLPAPSVPPGAVIGSLLARSATSLRRIPAALIPVIVMPVFFTVAFSNTFRGLTLLPGYPTDNIYNWMVPYACVQSSALGALAAAFALGRDLEGGFYDRLLLSPGRRWVVPGAGVLGSVIRCAIPLVITLTVGTIGGLTFPGGVVAAIGWLMVASAGTAALAALWGLGVMYRVKRQSAGGLVQIGLFIVLFLSIGTVPLDLQEGWLPRVARFNPITPILTLARAGFVEPFGWASVWPGLVSIAVCGVVLAVWAERGMRTLVP